MKSIVEEASSIVKAIEKAWIRAGKPTSFQVKVFEEPQRNFFGLMVRSAKIGLFFAAEGVPAKKTVKTEPRKEQPVMQVRKERVSKTRWNQEMIDASKQWLDQILKSAGYSSISYTVEPKGYYLNILFTKPILADKTKEQMLFKSCAHLLMQMLQTKLKKGLAGFKVVLKGV